MVFQSSYMKGMTLVITVTFASMLPPNGVKADDMESSMKTADLN